MKHLTMILGVTTVTTIGLILPMAAMALRVC